MTVVPVEVRVGDMVAFHLEGDRATFIGRVVRILPGRRAVGVRRANDVGFYARSIDTVVASDLVQIESGGVKRWSWRPRSGNVA